MTRIFLITIVFLSIQTIPFSQVVNQFRGVHRDGIYQETGLMQSWPEEGPSLLWKYDGIGNGYSSPVLSGDRIYITGEVDSAGYLTVIDRSGKFLWKKETGREWMENFTGSRATPTLVDNLIYICTSMGKIMCMNIETGNEVWSLDMINDLHGINVRFGYSEGLLVDGNTVFCAPGGPDTNIVALDRFTGKMIWKSKVRGDTTAYCSPIIVNLPERKLLVTYSIHHLMGLDAASGELLWSLPQNLDADIQACTPVYIDHFLYTVNGSGNGAAKYQISPDGSKITTVWENEEVSDVHGGFVKLGDFLYTSQYHPRRYCSVDCQSGKIVDSLKFDKGAIIAAENMLYLYTEKGKIGLVKPVNGKMELVGSAKIPVGSKEYFTIPVIDRGVLYVRHGDSILAYDVSTN
jgi:outer membrane protein assembly factor BamB